MDIGLTPQQIEALRAHPGQPLSMVDESSSERFFLLSEPAFLHLQGLAGETGSESHRRLKQLIQEGIDSPAIPADEALARLREVANKLAQPRT